MNIVELIQEKIRNIPLELHNLGLYDIKLNIDKNNQILYFEKLLPKVCKQYVTGHKLIAFHNEDYFTKECICLYGKSLLNNNVGFLKKSDTEFEIEPAATFWSESLDDDTRKILKLLNIRFLEEAISYYDSKPTNTIVKLVIKI